MDFFNKINWMPVIAVLLVIFIILMAVVIGLDNRNASNPSVEEPNSQPVEMEPLTILTITDQGDRVIVATNYCAVKYPYSLSDLVKVETINEDNKATLRFYTILNGMKMPLYDLVIGGQGEMLLGTITMGIREWPMYVVIHSAMPALDESSRFAFIAAQETINDVTTSMRENSNFEPAN